MRTNVLLIATLSLAATLVVAQNPVGRFGGFTRGSRGSAAGRYGQRGRRSPAVSSRNDYPTWEIPREFKDDVFTFVRIEYDSTGSFAAWERWDNDYPDGDWNFSYRLQQLTSLEVEPNGKAMRLTDPELFNYPFVYMSGVQRMVLTRDEQTAFGRYLLSGGFVMIDDLWNPQGWAHVRRVMEAVLPGHSPIELTIDHPIFHIVFDLKDLPQVTDIQTWSGGDDFEYYHGATRGDEAPHFWAYFDEKGRMMALVCHNNDLGDGWEREGENEDYFHRYSEKLSYPFGINVIVYAMTH